MALAMGVLFLHRLHTQLIELVLRQVFLVAVCVPAQPLSRLSRLGSAPDDCSVVPPVRYKLLPEGISDERHGPRRAARQIRSRDAREPPFLLLSTLAVHTCCPHLLSTQGARANAGAACTADSTVLDHEYAAPSTLAVQPNAYDRVDCLGPLHAQPPPCLDQLEGRVERAPSPTWGT